MLEFYFKLPDKIQNICETLSNGNISVPYIADQEISSEWFEISQLNGELEFEPRSFCFSKLSSFYIIRHLETKG